MIRSRASDDGLLAQVRLSSREVARAVEETGHPAAAFAEAEFVLAYTDADVRTPAGYGPPMVAMVTDGPADRRARAWVREHASVLPQWRLYVTKEEADVVDEFHVAGHVPKVDAAGRVVDDWRDEREEEHLGLVCTRCGHGIDVGRTRVDEVPECGGTRALLRRLHARRSALLIRIADLDAEIAVLLEEPS